MKKIIKICVIILVVMAGIVTGTHIYHISKNAFYNSNIEVGIKKIEIVSAADKDYDYYFESQKWPETLKRQVDDNKSEYAILYITYIVRNDNDRQLVDIRFHQKFEKNLKKIVKEYTTGNGEFFIDTAPHLRGALTSYALIQANESQYDKIYNNLLKQKIRFEYGVNTSIPHVYSVSGPYQYDFIIGDAVDAYRNNPENFN